MKEVQKRNGDGVQSRTVDCDVGGVTYGELGKGGE